ncbi:MAG: NAD(P)/FAD-dependent oxidoreductase [Solirubrobacteraceae bacterium]
MAVRDRSEIAALHGTDGQLESVTLKSGQRLRFSYLFVFLGAMPCTEWLGDAVERDEHGFILTGSASNGEKLLETSVPGILAAGDVRSGSTKRCATAVGKGRGPYSSSTPTSRHADRQAPAGQLGRRTPPAVPEGSYVKRKPWTDAAEPV